MDEKSRARQKASGLFLFGVVLKQGFAPNEGKPAFSRKESGMNSILWCGNHAGNPGSIFDLTRPVPQIMMIFTLENT
jgi:hypothetical protein